MDGNQALLGAGDASSSSSSDAPEDLLGNSEHPFVKALKLDLVVDKLMTFLTFEDMKALSAVSRDFLTAVRKTKNFANSAKLVISKEVIESHILDDSTYLWKYITLDLCMPNELVELVKDILETAVGLSLKLPSAKEDAEVASFIGEIFKYSENLKSLTIDVLVMNKILHDVFSNVKIQSRLSHLETLIIQGFEIRKNSTCYIDALEDDGETPFQRNFFQLSMLPLNLKKFVFGKVSPVSGYGGSESEHVKFIPKIVEATKETLEELELHLKIWSFDDMKGIRCSKLKRLTISACEEEKYKKIVETFLKNQPPLEELSLEINDGIPFSILGTLQGMLGRLKKLHLKAKRFIGTTSAVDWKFLESMGELRDFCIRKPFCTEGQYRSETYGYGEDILSKLPATTEKISLIGFIPFWREDNADSENSNNIGLMLMRFENLKELNLLRSNGSVTDEGLQSIIQTCPKLVSLVFSHCYELTGKGLTGKLVDNDGIEVEDTKISLKNLQGLNRLKIRSCPNISPEEILSIATFPHLRSFDYYRNVDVPKETLLQIVRQNLCLEELSIHTRHYDQEYINSLKKEIREISPRVHKVQILEQSNWEDEDSDSDASSLHEDGFDGDSDISGGGYHERDYDDFYDHDSPNDYFNSNSDEDDEYPF